MSDKPQDYHDYLFRIIYRDTDQMGFVYYANYFAFMEIGRVELMRAKGSSYKAMEESGVYIPVVHAHCDYKKPAHYDDLLRIRTRITLLTRVRLHFAYEIYRTEPEELLAQGETHHVFMEKSGRPVRISKELKDWLETPVNAAP